MSRINIEPADVVVKLVTSFTIKITNVELFNSASIIVFLYGLFYNNFMIINFGHFLYLLINSLSCSLFEYFKFMILKKNDLVNFSFILIFYQSYRSHRY